MQPCAGFRVCRKAVTPIQAKSYPAGFWPSFNSAAWRMFSSAACTITSMFCSSASTTLARRSLPLTFHTPSATRWRSFSNSSSSNRDANPAAPDDVKLQILHRTEYAYREPVTDSFNEVRLQPISADGQICHSFVLKVLPSARLSHFLDFNLNYVHFFEVMEPHSSLTVESASIVTTSGKLYPEDEQPAPMKDLQGCNQLEQCYDFLQSSSYVHLGPEVWKLAMDACFQATDV